MEGIKKFFKRLEKNNKISLSLKEYHREHRNQRKIPVYQLGQLVDYIYLPKRKPLIKSYLMKGGEKT